MPLLLGCCGICIAVATSFGLLRSNLGGPAAGPFGRTAAPRTGAANTVRQRGRVRQAQDAWSPQDAPTQEAAQRSASSSAAVYPGSPGNEFAPASPRSSSGGLPARGPGGHPPPPPPPKFHPPPSVTPSPSPSPAPVPAPPPLASLVAGRSGTEIEAEGQLDGTRISSSSWPPGTGAEHCKPGWVRIPPTRGAGFQNRRLDGIKQPTKISDKYQVFWCPPD